MEDQTKTKIRILLVEPEQDSREKLVKQICRTDLSTEIAETDSVNSASKLLKSADFDLCILGLGLNEETQRRFLSSAPQGGQRIPCAMVPLVHNTDNETLLSYVRDGAHALLLPPLSPSSLTEVIRTALRAAGTEADQGEETSEHINSLPWILENFAKRLEDIAARLKTAEESGIVIEATPKIVSEALLSTIAASSEPDEQAVENIVQLLLKDHES